MTWYDVYDNMIFDNVEVQRVTRTEAAATTGIVVLVLSASLAAIVLGVDGPLPLWLGIGLAVAAWTTLSAWLFRRYQRLRRVVWCVKLSKDEVVGYDYARRRITIPWPKVQRLELDSESLTIVGPEPLSLEISHLFPDFAQVSHRVMHYADRHGVAVFVDGRPWQQIDVYDVFPFLSKPSPQRGSAAT